MWFPGTSSVVEVHRLVAPLHVGSSGTRDGTRVSCTQADSPPLSRQGSPPSPFLPRSPCQELGADGSQNRPFVMGQAPVFSVLLQGRPLLPLPFLLTWDLQVPASAPRRPGKFLSGCCLQHESPSPGIEFLCAGGVLAKPHLFLGVFLSRQHRRPLCVQCTDQFHSEMNT